MFKKLFCNVPSVLYQNRFCSQEQFDIIASLSSRKLVKLHYPSFDRLDPILTYENSSYCSVVTSSDVYTFCEQDDFNIFRYEGKECEKMRYNKKVVLPEKAVIQFACSFMKYLFVYIESLDKYNATYCLMYNIKTLQWTYIANWNSYREQAACVIFEGKIVVSGGNTCTVESYDYYGDNWSYLPDMIEPRYNHGVVSMGNKMFVIGGWRNIADCEVFDSSSRKFTSIKKMFVVNNLDVGSKSVFGIGGNITVFLKCAHSVENKLIQTYDVLENKWYLEDDFIGDIDYVISCSKLPVA